VQQWTARTSAHGTTRPRRPLASRSAYWGSAAFLGVLRVSAVQLPDLEIEHTCEGDPGGKRQYGRVLKIFFTNPSTEETDINEFLGSHHDFLGSSKRHRNEI
jgi:hypothetical protein